MPKRARVVRFAYPAFVFVVSATYFAWGVSSRAVSVLESQDFGIACDLFKTFSLSPDHSPLHFVFMNLWQRLDGSSIAFLRIPSVVFCALAVSFTFRLAERIARSRFVGLLSAAFLTTNPEVVDNAQSMRMYSLVVLSTAMCLWFAHSYLATNRRKSDLIAFCASAIVGIYNHLFMWLPVGSLALVIALDLWRNRRSREERTRVVRWAVLTLVVLTPQIIHIFVAIGFTRGRHALYRGLPTDGVSFLLPIVRSVFLGESERLVSLGNWVLLAPLALSVLGIITTKRTGAIVAASIFVPAIVVAWVLGWSNPIEPRYLNFLTPASAILMAIGAAHASPRARRWLGVPLSIAVLTLSCYATQITRAGPSPTTTSCDEIGPKLAAARGQDDVVFAVFPGFWNPTFRRYANTGESVPISFPIDLDRALSRGKRVLLVRYPGREFGSVEAFLAANSHYRELFRTTSTPEAVVYSVMPKDVPQTTLLHAPRDSSLVLTGIVGSGGYAWQPHASSATATTATTSANPFALLTTLAPAGHVIAGYVPYRVPWHAGLLLGREEVRRLEPNAVVPSFLAETHLTNAALVCDETDGCNAGSTTLAANGIHVIPREPVLYDVGGTTIGVFTVGLETTTTNNANASVDEIVNVARSRVGPNGHLIALVHALADYARLPTADERRVARHLIDVGVDVVAGLGGYAVKELEEYGRGIIAYSLGTLLRPPTLCLASGDSSGIALRVGFTNRSEKPTYDVIPLTFDDTSRVAFGRASSVAHLVHEKGALADMLEQAATSYQSSDGGGGATHDLGTWNPDRRSATSAIERWFFTQTATLTAWFPEAPQNTPLRPFDGAHSLGGSGGGPYVARRGVSSLGELRNAIELETGGNLAVSARFKDVRLTKSLELSFALPDDRLRSKFVAFPDQRLIVRIGEREVLNRNVPYRVGWNHASIDTTLLRETSQDVTIILRTDDGTHFPIAIDAQLGD